VRPILQLPSIIPLASDLNFTLNRKESIQFNEETTMKHNIVWTLFLIAMLSLSLAAVAKDKDNEDRDGYTCSPAKVAGTWGYSETGTMILPPALAGYLGLPVGPNPYASVGSYTLDRQGIVSGARTASLGGITLVATITGTAEVNPTAPAQ
jgi:hypothetical protein